MRTLFISLLGALIMSTSIGHAAESRAVFAGGCFWCMQPVFDNTEGVSQTFVGYLGGTVANPTYEQISTGKTGHYEAIEVRYDPAKVSYEKLLELFWQNIDPFDANGQFADKGTQYHTAIFYGNDKEKKAAEASKAKLQAQFKKPIATKILPTSTFYPAEDYHQKYYEKNSVHYNAYKYGSGRTTGLKEIWGEHDKK